MVEIRTVLCPVDFGDASQRCFDAAIAVARRFDARLVLQHNLESRPPGFLSVNWMWSEDHEGEEEANARAVGERLQELLAQVPPSVPREAKLTRGPLEESILEVASRLPADVIVVSTRGRSDSAHSSLTERLVSRAPCTVLVLGENCAPTGLFSSDEVSADRLAVLAPADLEAGTRDVLALLDGLSDIVLPEIHLLHVLQNRVGDVDRAAFEARDRVLELLPEGLHNRVQVDIRFGQPDREILRAASEYGAVLILMAAHRKGALARWAFGDNAVEVLHESPCPVWFVPVNWAPRSSAAGEV